MGASASVQEQGRAWWGTAHAVKEALEGGTWRQLLEQHKADVNTADPHTRRTLLHEVLQPGCRGVGAAAEAVKFLVEECGAASVPDGEGRIPVWYALQHRDGDTRSALLAALGEQVGKMHTEVVSRLQCFLTDEWPPLMNRETTTDRTPSGAPQPQLQDYLTQKPTDKDKAGERLEHHVDGRKICFTRNDASCETRLLDWLVQLLTVHPDLGYRAKHVDSMLLGLRFVVQRVLREMEKAPDKIEDWMAVDDWFEHLCAGYLFTCDCVEYQINSETCDIACNADGAPIVKEYHKDLTDATVLKNHGADKVRPALYFGMNQAMRTIGLSKEVRESAAADSVFKLEPAPAQLHVIATFQPLIAKLTRLIRSRRASLTTVFRGINVNVSAKYKVGTSVVWNAFTSTTKKQAVAKSFMYGNGTFFVIVAKQGAAEVGFASVFPQEAELLYDSNIEFRVQWKLSPTLLRMVGQPFDVIVMQEVTKRDNDDRHNNADYSVSDQVEAVRQVLQHTASLFAEFLDSYVEGRVGDDTHVPEEETKMLLHEVDEWLVKDGDARGTGRHPLCLIWDGGTGKTSAAVAVLCHLLQEKKEDAGGVAGQRKKPVFPVFVALPAIGVSTVTTHGGIDEFIGKSFGLDEAALEHLSSEYDVVVILDSLDEVGLTQTHLSDAYKASGWQGLMQLHPWCAKQCSVIVTTRGEYLKSVNHTASQVCGDGTRSLYMQPFTQADAETYIGKVRAPLQQLAAEPLPQHTVAEAELAMLSKLRNPFLLHMACYAQRELMSQAQAQQCLSDVMVYEAYLQKHVEVELRQLRQGQADAGAAGVEEVLRVGGLIACAMLEAQTWQGVLGEERARLLKEDNVRNAEADEAFRVLPFRVESFEEEGSAFTFRHKTLGEFLVARRLSRKGGVGETLGSKVRRAFSQDAPNVLEYFADTVLARGGDDRDTTVTIELLPLVLATRAAGADAVSLASASNAMALAVRTRHAFNCDLSGVLVQDSDLRHARLCATVLENSRFHNCWLEHAFIWKANLTRSDWEGSSFGAPLPPLLGHTDRVKSVSVTPDGSKIISGSEDKSVRVWDTSTGKELQKLEGHTAPVLSVTVTPDGSKILSGSEDKSVRVWDTSTGKELQKLEGHTSSVNSVAVTPDGSKIISASGDLEYIDDSSGSSDSSSDNSVRVWDTSTGKELQKLEGHTSSVNSVAVTPDGSKIISASGDLEYIDDSSGSSDSSSDNSVRVWDTSTGKELQKLEGHTSSVNSVTVTPDGSKIISGSEDNSVRVWDTSTGKELQKLEGHTSPVNSVSVTPDGSKILSGSGDDFYSDYSVRVWDTSSGKELQKLEGHTCPVNSVAVTPDGSKIVSGSEDNSVRVWDTASGNELQKLEGHTSPVNSVTVTPDGSKILSASGYDSPSDYSVRVWDTSSGKELQKLEGHTCPVNSVAVTPDGSKIVSGSEDNSVRVWDTASGNELQKLEGHTSPVNSVTVTPDGSKILSASGYDSPSDYSVRVWDTSSGKELQKLEGHTSPVNSVAVTPDGSNIISGSGDKSVCVWDTSTGKELQKLEGHTSPVNSVAVTPDGSKIISGSGDKSVRVWDTSSGKELQKLEGHASPVNSVTVTPDGSKILSACGNQFSSDYSVRVWDTSTGRELQNLEGHTSFLNSVSVTPDGAKIISGSSDDSVRVWDTSSGKELLKLEGHTSCVNSVTVAPDGSKIISASRDTSVRVWDTSSGKELQKLEGHTSPVNSVAVTPDGSKIISGSGDQFSSDNSVRVWDTSSGKELLKLEGHTAYLNSVAVTPDGAKIISASQDKSVRVWDTSTGKELPKSEGHTESVNSVTLKPDGLKVISASDNIDRVSDTKELQELEGHTEAVYTVSVTPDGAKIISASKDKSLRVWDTSTGKELQNLTGHTSDVFSVAITPDGSKTVSASKDGNVCVWDLSTCKELHKLAGHTDCVYTVAVTPDGSKIISGSRDRSVRVWDISTGKELQKLDSDTSSVNSVAIVPDGSKVISASKDNSVRVWDTSTGKELQKLEGHTSSVYSVAVTPDGLKVISASKDNSVRVWDTSTGKELLKLEGHTSSVYCVAVTPDGSKIISASSDKSVRVWDTSTGKELQKLEGHTAPVLSVTVTPDGSKIISGSRDKSVRVWGTSTDKQFHGAVCENDAVPICAAFWRLRTVIGIGPVVPVPFQCTELDTVTPPAACSVLGGAVLCCEHSVVI